MNPFAFLWRQREAERPEKELSDVGVKEWPPAVYHREIYRQRLNDITIPCSNYYSVSQSSFTEYVGLAPPECDWESYPDFVKIRIVCKSEDGYLHERIFEGSPSDVLLRVQESFSLVLDDPSHWGRLP